MQMLSPYERAQRLKRIFNAEYEADTREDYAALNEALNKIIDGEKVLLTEGVLDEMPRQVIERAPFTTLSNDNLNGYVRMLAIMKLARYEGQHTGGSLLLAAFMGAYYWGHRDGYAHGKHRAGLLLDRLEQDITRNNKRRAKVMERQIEQALKDEEAFKRCNEIWKETGFHRDRDQRRYIANKEYDRHTKNKGVKP